MPVSGPSSYLPTIDAFIAHWASVNTALGGAGLKLGGTYTATNLGTDRANLLAKITAVDVTRTANLGASQARDILRGTVKERIRQFNAFMRGNFPNTVYINQLGKVPGSRQGIGSWQLSLDLTKNCWDAIDATTPVLGFIPVILSGSYSNASFTTDRTNVLADFSAVTTAVQNFQTAVEARDAAFALIRARLVQYRPAVEGAFASGSALITSIPALTPAKGSTPKAVRLTAVWNATTSKADLTWAPSDDARVTGCEVRACYNQSYKTADEASLGFVALGTNSFSDDTGLGASGAYVTYKVYTLTATGNEKGSNSEKVTRP